MTYNKFWKSKERDIIIHNNKMNIIESCIDRHAKNNPNKPAFIFQDNKIQKYTYKQLQEQVNKFANLLNKLKIKQNSHIFLFLPKVPELYIGFLGAIKQGSIAVPLFEAFQSQGLKLRLDRGDADILITNKELSKRIPKNIKEKIPSLKHILIIDEKNYKKQIKEQSIEFNTILKNKLDTATMIFTSSTAGTPVAGIQIPHQALIQQHYTAKLVLRLTSKTQYWCTAHPGWVTGSIYGIIAPLSIGCTIYILKEHFKAVDWIKFLQKNKISVFYTAPTALRLLKPIVKKQDLESLKVLASVGEALTKTTFNFFKDKGIEITDTFWQTETGAIMISSYDKKQAGRLGQAIPGITAEIKDKIISFKPNFPAIMTGIYKHPKMYQSYFKNGWFKTNDVAKKDKKGYFFFQHRKDDIIKTSGERVSPIEIESVLMKHKAVHEAAAVGIPDKIKGQIIKAFIVLNKNIKPSEDLKQELAQFVKQNYAGHAYPKQIEFIKKMPKTNSGKIIRMKLRNKNYFHQYK